MEVSLCHLSVLGIFTCHIFRTQSAAVCLPSLIHLLYVLHAFLYTAAVLSVEFTDGEKRQLMSAHKFAKPLAFVALCSSLSLLYLCWPRQSPLRVDQHDTVPARVRDGLPNIGRQKPPPASRYVSIGSLQHSDSRYHLPASLLPYLPPSLPTYLPPYLPLSPLPLFVGMPITGTKSPAEFRISTSWTRTNGRRG